MAPPVSGYTAWYDASQITGVADGASLSSWPDLSGNGYNATQSTGADQPTFYKTTAAKLINGLPAVWFNGSSDQMNASTMPSQAQPITAFVVLQSSSPSSYQEVLTDHAGACIPVYLHSSQYYALGRRQVLRPAHSPASGTVTDGTARNERLRSRKA